jgi:hypothetical protein
MLLLLDQSTQRFFHLQMQIGFDNFFNSFISNQNFLESIS